MKLPGKSIMLSIKNTFSITHENNISHSNKYWAFCLFKILIHKKCDHQNSSLFDLFDSLVLHILLMVTYTASSDPHLGATKVT